MDFKAIIFDLDGVITDTSRFHYIAWKALAEYVGISIDESFNERLKGVGRMESLELILQYGGLSEKYSQAEKEALAERKNDHYVALLQQITPDNVLPGIPAFLKACHDHGIPTALASASRNAPFILDKLGLTGDFGCIADAAKVAHSKPAPDIFLAAAEGLGIAPENCIGIEDAAAGIEAIHAAGMRAVGIGSAETLHEADLLFPETRALTLESVKQYFTK